MKGIPAVESVGAFIGTRPYTYRQLREMKKKDMGIGGRDPSLAAQRYLR